MKNISGLATRLIGTLPYYNGSFTGIYGKSLIRNNIHHSNFTREDKKEFLEKYCNYTSDGELQAPPIQDDSNVYLSSANEKRINELEFRLTNMSNRIKVNEEQINDQEFILINKNDFASMKESGPRVSESTEGLISLGYWFSGWIIGTVFASLVPSFCWDIIFSGFETACNSLSSNLLDDSTTLGDGAINEQDSSLVLG